MKKLKSNRPASQTDYKDKVDELKCVVRGRRMRKSGSAHRSQQDDEEAAWRNLPTTVNMNNQINIEEAYGGEAAAKLQEKNESPVYIKPKLSP